MAAEADGVSRLGDEPAWTYLLKEYYEFYRFLPSGGSDRIRAHQRAVREAINRARRPETPVRFAPAASLPVLAHFRRALDEGKEEKFSSLIRALDAVKSSLAWRYGYDRMPRLLMERYGYAELAGPNGPVVTAEVILGVVLFAPGTTYPTHAHGAITESYICLSGAISENHEGVYAPGSLIFNPPGKAHRITTSKDEPSLLAYAWHGQPEALADHKMVLG